MALTCPGTPGIGSSLEVLHHRGRVIPRHPPPAGPAASPGDEASPDTVATPPGPMEMLGDVLRHLDDAARLAHRATPATTGGVGDDTDASSEAATAPEMSVAQLAALAERDADGAADEILRRIESGETTAVHLVGAARGLDAAGRTGALAALSALHARGAIDDARMALVQMMLRVPE